MRILIGFAALALSGAAIAQTDTYTSQLVPLVQSSVTSSLKDPSSAQFTWADRAVDGVYRDSIWQRKHAGTIICGTVNAKNSYGGYSGQYAFAAVVNDGTVSYLDMDQPGQYSASAQNAADQCRKLGIGVL